MLILRKNTLYISELIEERAGDFGKNNTEQLFESIETNAKGLAHALHRYNILKATYNDDLDTQIRSKVSGKSTKNIPRQKDNEEKEYLASVVDLCSELLKNSKSERKKVKKVLKELFNLDSLNLFTMSLVLLPKHIPMVLFTAWLEVNMSDYDPNAPYNFSPWLDSLSWPAWLALMYGFTFVLSFFWKQMSKTEAAPTNK